MIPKKIFFTKGVGFHKNKLQSFELALRNAGVEKCNLVNVSSIFPPNCKLITKEKGLKELRPGEITFVVMARECTNEPHRQVFSSIGFAKPVNTNQYGYLSEHHGYGETKKRASDFSEDLAATMLASTLGFELDPTKAWDERKKLYIASGKKFMSNSITQTEEGHKDGLWTTVIACAVMILKNDYD